MKIIIFTHHQPTLFESWFVNELKTLKKSKIDFTVFFIKSLNLSERHSDYKRYKNHFQKLHVFSDNILAEIVRTIYYQLKALFKYKVKYLQALYFVAKYKSKATLRSFLRIGILLGKKREFDADIIYCHSLYDDYLLSFFSALFLSKKFGAIPHSYSTYKYPEYVSYLCRKASFIIVKADYMKRRYLKRFKGLKSDSVKVLSWGIDTEFFRKKKQRFKKGSIFEIISVARLVDKKGIDDLIVASSRLARDKFKFKVKIYGDGGDKDKLKDLIKKYNQSNVVSLSTPVKNRYKLRRIYQGADLFVLPSRIGANGRVDVVPNAVLEAMSMEVPVATTKASGMGEFIKDGREGFIVNSNNEDDLKNKVEKVSDLSTDKKKKIGRAARQVVVSKFNYQRQARRFVEYLKSQAFLKSLSTTKSS